MLLSYSPKPTTPNVMVASNPSSPHPERRSLSPEATRELHRALAAHWRDPAGSEQALNRALAAGADDARTRGLRPEELLLALKAIEEEVSTALDVVETQDRDRFRIWLVGACMRAFFRSDLPTES